jgi:hypothetical protein
VEVRAPKGKRPILASAWKRSWWSATTGICTRKDGRELFAVFSSNAPPFEPPNEKSCSTYNKFSVYAKLNHGGDFKAAARALANPGYGEPPQSGL